ncbi:MAG: CBS domain-containing protein [Oligoflexia bacterium]|nr:CBS domain-containing protein [Oligoflexia bacterium]MBF0367258.1 CBS domain-containing protein [Oligoflexia bacterium]
MIKAKDIMQKEAVSLQANSTISEMIALLVKHKITGIPIVDPKNILIGIISEKDLLGCIFAPNLGNKAVKDLMATKVVSMDEDASIIEVCLLLSEKNFRRVPIVNKNQELVGIVSRSDLIAYVYEQFKKGTPIKIPLHC